MDHTATSKTLSRKEPPKLTMHEKIYNEEILTRINRKIDFKKNPRYEGQRLPKFSEINGKQVLQSISQSNINTADVREGPLRCDPPQIVFSNYQQDRVYEFEVSLVNISRVMKRIKLAPIKSPEFTVSEVKYPSGESGDIAPGMAAKVTVWFKPTMLRYYGDELIVMSEDNVFKVPIIARREQTNINLPKQLDCGNCWVGDSLTTTYELVNTGGATKFELSCESGVVSDGVLQIGQFNLQPSSFSLDKNQRVVLTGRYSPKQYGKLTERIRVSCDNGTQLSFELTGCGYAAYMALLSVNGEKVDPQLSNYRIYFEKLVPRQKKISEIVVKNLATVDLKYRFRTEPNSKLMLEELQGTFKPMEERILKIAYTSEDTVPKFERLYLELLDIPPQSIRSRAASTNGAPALYYYRFEVVTCPVPLSMKVLPNYYRFPEAIYRGAHYLRKFQLVNLNETDVYYQISSYRKAEGVQSSLKSPAKATVPKNSTVDIEIDFQITTLDSTLKKVEYLVEFVNAPSQFIEIEAESRSPKIELHTERIDFGLLKTFSKGVQALLISNPCPVEVQVQLINYSKYYDNDFDDFYIYDDENVSCKFKRLVVEEPDIIIPAQSAKEVHLSYNSRDCETFNNKLQLRVVDGYLYELDVFAEVQDIHVALSKSSFSLNEIFVGNVYDIERSGKSRRPLFLMNLSNLYAEFKWDIPKSDSYEVSITPQQGSLSPKAKQKVTVVVTPLRTTSLNLSLKCHVTSVQDPLYLEVIAEMRGLEVAYHLVDESLAKKVKVKDTIEDMNRTKSKKFTTVTLTSGFASASIGSREKETTVYPMLERLEFFNCEINKPRQIDISLENLSDLNTEFEVEALNYKTLEKEQKESKQKSNLLGATALAFTSQMGKTLIANRQLEQSQKQHLSNNKGLSILCEPRKGELLKSSTVNIRITLFNDICGRFSDRLVVNIKNHEKKEFPVEIDIKGTPVCVSRNQAGINFNKEMPLYKLGVFPVKSGLVRKEFRVTNNGPKPVEISWKIFSSQMKSDRDLFKLQLTDPAPGSQDAIGVHWNPIEPDEEKDSPFAIEPRNKILQGREESAFVVSFKTSEEPSVAKSILIGEPRLQISGTDKAKMELLTIVVQAETIQPELSIDPTFTNVLTKFQKLAGQLSPKDTKTVMLENHTDASLIFSVEIPEKWFEIVASSCNSQSSNAFNDPKLLTSSKGFMRKTLQQTVQTSFNLVPRTHVELKVQLKGDCKNLEEWPLLNKIRREGRLIVTYANGHSQQFDLVGELYRPVLQLNTTGFEGQAGEDLIEFGTVHTKNNKTLAIYLTNVSLVKAKWSLKYVKFPSKKPFEPVLWTKMDHYDQYITDDKDCFQFSLTEGTCESLSVPIHLMPTTLALPAPDDEYAKTHIPQKILINFKPKKNVLYKSRFKILVEDGYTFEFTVRGVGTYTEEREK